MAENLAKSAWTETEKLNFLISVVKHQPVKWDEVAIPEGRTKKACQEMFRRLQASVEKDTDAGKGATNGKETGEPNSPKTPRKRAPSKKKTDAEAQADEEDGPKTSKPKGSARKKDAGDDNGAKKSPTKKAKGTPKAKSTEPGEDDATVKDEEVKDEDAEEDG
ncbi:hypothetical protein H2201_007239 [Coniosporium apollinis]|uniref:Myb-like domain-containing protein n=2 Tax=Coniosporium TaxID=2810619 RepID=A0ABQ9NR85_9PEZI|nr:hypothetical protein H2199_001034 [Cladosporium sp. JES 115]KAJ9659648.1 hypothetical protein H2201_007239 [Coniosporium apollinis]